MSLDRKVPIVAFFGTRGGVGKTTITNKFADLVVVAETAPRVLLIDLDVSARGTTVLRISGPINCRTIHDYVRTRSTEIEEALDVTNTVDVMGKKDKGGKLEDVKGKLYLIPSATAEAAQIFRTTADIGYQELLGIVRGLIDSAASKYNISCVLIDCGPTIDPYTAAAAQLADRAFIIGQNEPISREALRDYRAKIRDDFYSNFNFDKMAIILNKVRAVVPEAGFSAIIPFTIDIVDISEGIKDVDEVRLALLDHYIFDLLRKTLEKDYPDLVPNARAILPKEWSSLVERAPELAKSLRMKGLGISKWVLPFGVLLSACLLILRFIFDIDFVFDIDQASATSMLEYLVALGMTVGVPLGIALAIISGGVWYQYREPKPYIDNLMDRKENFLFEELQKKSGRRVLSRIKDW